MQNFLNEQIEIGSPSVSGTIGTTIFASGSGSAGAMAKNLRRDKLQGIKPQVDIHIPDIGYDMIRYDIYMAI
jgi:hypothetical protein